ncbi:hypothetical protein [Bradyrhizobium canariense]|uniref:Uncharacterized protein n=1 Tax=Bradyrhizobium canariense TaxID=255045 RepID=A0A1X3GJI9_9BRAD|nr:hypothetical protein [Bradyrhizobium canariense]OSI68900.1 hypothetical protein BSZ22_19945 [Bradyrhizobium canariense]OSI79388.1 hypothetical protein BSZ23_14995 [Bradyrhizobium canariense]OSI89614.1 hypothetical protein BSZ25_20405 [Bradyrhizobium canariense]OSI91008.1 hypothetical protein BSZ24_18800 [Bradyrhizobium canariense]OSJ03980.1 hypothetical protein BSZ16_14840 [Bradyrhizobium canariense]
MSGKEINRHYMQDVQFEMLVHTPGDPAEPCIVVQGVTEHVYLPVSKLSWFDWRVVCLLDGASEQIGGPTERIKRLDAIAPQSLDITRTGDGKVAVIVDYGHPTQLVVTLEPEVASGLGASLIAAGSDASATSTKH